MASAPGDRPVIEEPSVNTLPSILSKSLWPGFIRGDSLSGALCNAQGWDCKAERNWLLYPLRKGPLKPPLFSMSPSRKLSHLHLGELGCTSCFQTFPQALPCQWRLGAHDPKEIRRLGLHGTRNGRCRKESKLSEMRARWWVPHLRQAGYTSNVFFHSRSTGCSHLQEIHF